MDKIDRLEFVKVMAYIAAGVGKSPSADAAEVYYDLLADLPLAVLQAAARIALVEHVYPTFPTVGQLRQIAARIQAGGDGRMLAVEAWEMVNKLARDHAWDVAGEAVKALPAKVRRAAGAVGWRSIFDSTNRETLRAQFCKAFDELADRDRKDLALPAPVKESLERLEQPASVLQFVGKDFGRGQG